MKRLLTYAILAVGLLAVAIGLWKAHEDRFDPFAHLPTANSTLASIDFNALRRAGILDLVAAKPGTEEPEYLTFIRTTGFDYQKDLDRVAAAFTPDSTYLIVQGRFDWTKLEAFAQQNGGGCYERLCHLPGSQPSRQISFLPLKPNIMALAVSSNNLAVANLRDSKSVTANPSAIPSPQAPVWLSIPAVALKRIATLSPSLRLFAASVTGADRVTLTLGPQSKGDYAAHLEVLCTNPETARTVTTQLTKVSAALKSVLVQGSFQQSNQKVFGYWPIPKSFIESFVGGI